MVIKVGINGFGRIGRVIFRTCLQNPDIELSAINDPAIDIEYICYLIKFDSTHGKFKGNITHTENTINIDARVIKVFREKLPHTVPWQVAGVQYVVEASGMFTGLEKSSGHLASDGVKRVIVTAPSLDVPMVILGVNDNQLNAEQKVLSCASSTLYCLAPIVKVLQDNFGVSEGFITSIHAMTPSLKPLDGLCLKGKHWRDHRSIHQNIIPATTGSCKALAKIIPQVKDKMAGLAFRVPIVNVSVLDMTVRLDTNTSLQDIFNSVETASKTSLRNIIKISNEETVSSDFSGDSNSCILDAASSLQLKPNFYKIICWYENEFSYACRVIDSIFFSERQFNTPVRLPCKMTYVRAKLAKKQDELQQTERNSKETSSIECNTVEVPKCTTSAQDNMLRKPPARPVVLRKQPHPHSSGIPVAEPAVPRDSKKRNELFKIWNDNNDAQKTAARQNRSSFFHSCMALGPKQADNAADCVKAQERLENVKKEFSKMINITEDLLKKSNADKLQPGSPQKSSLLGVKLSANGGSIDSKIPIEGNNSRTDNSISGVYSDKTGLSASHTDCRNEAERCSSSRNENNSGYKIASAVKKIVINLPYLIPSRDKIACLAKQNTITNFGQKATVENKLSAKAHVSLKSNSKCNTNINFKPHITKNDKYFMDSLSNKSPVQCAMKDQKRSSKNSDTAIKQNMKGKQMEIKITEGCPSPQVNFEKQASQEQELDPPEERPHKDLGEYLQKKDYNMRIIDEALQKRNIVLVKNEKPSKSELSCKISNISSEQMNAETEIRGKTLNKQILETLIRRVSGPVVVVPVEPSNCVIPDRTGTTTSTRTKIDLYEKLDSTSATDSTNSFEINEKKSQVLQICDLSNSIEDLTRLDKICRIIEISDELSDKLFSSLDHTELTGLQKKSWSFRDLCERLQLDDFCNKVFGKSRS